MNDRWNNKFDMVRNIRHNRKKKEIQKVTHNLLLLIKINSNNSRRLWFDDTIYLSIDGCINQSISYYLMIGDNLLFNLIYCHSMNRQESTH